MKVLHDISILGMGHAQANLRTGIFRVVENVAEQLVKHEECKITFSTSIDIQNQKDSIAYLNSKQAFKHIPFSLSKNYDIRVNANFNKQKAATKRFALIEHVVNKKNANLTNYISNKLQIRTMWLKEKFYELKSKGDLIDTTDLEQADIYHSTYFAIPEQVHMAKKKSVFITSYDIIPIVCPQFVTPGHTEFFASLLNSMNPDTWVLCISDACRNDLLNYMGNRLKPERVKVTHLAASDSFYQITDSEILTPIRRKYSIPDGPYILSLCTLEPRKNIDSVIKAFAQMVKQERITDLSLVLVGGKGWSIDKMMQEIEASPEIKNKIIITGFVPDEDLAPLYSDALYFVYPSLYEGFGLPPLEAMQCGTPAITSNTTSLPEVVGDAGIMIDPTDLDALSEAMLSIYKSPALRQELSEKSLERAAKFSWERCTQETVDAYKKSL